MKADRNAYFWEPHFRDAIRYGDDVSVLLLHQRVHLPAILKSHVNASSSPPPRAGPSIAAIVGIGNESSLEKTQLRLVKNASTCPADMDRRSIRSAPAQKAVSLEDRIISTCMLEQTAINLNSLKENMRCYIQTVTGYPV